MDVFEAIAEPNRRTLLDLLADGGRSAGELVDALPSLTQPAVSRHLKVLKEAGLVDVRPEAQRRIYTLRPDGMAELDRWLDRYRRYWARSLDALEAHLAELHGERTNATTTTRTKTRKQKPGNGRKARR